MSEKVNFSQPDSESPSAETPGQPPVEAVVSPETGGDQPVAPADVASGGLKRVINTMRYLRTVDRAADLQTTAEVHQAVAGRREPGEKLYPATKSEVSQSRRADRRLRSNMSRSRVNYDLGKNMGVSTLNDDGQRVPLTRGELKDVMNSQRLSRIERKTIEKARKTYTKNYKVMNKRIEKVAKSAAGEDIPGRVISAQLDRTLARADRLREHLGVVQSIAQPETSAVPEEVVPVPAIVEPAATSVAAASETTTAPKTPEEINLEKLRALRDSGALPEPTSKTVKPAVNAPETTPTPEVAEKDVLSIAQGILAQVEQAQAGEPDLNKDDLILELLEKALVSANGSLDADISDKGVQILDAINKLETEASKPQPTEAQAATELGSAELLDQASIERLAEVAYIGAQDKIHLQIDSEDRQRRTDGKPKLTKEEKAEYWKNELDIREQLLGDLSPENKSLVSKQISELIKADKAAYREGKEKLRDKRRRERREQQAAKRQVQPAKTSQRSNETVQQRARRERKEKLEADRKAAASVNANAQRTAVENQ